MERNWDDEQSNPDWDKKAFQEVIQKAAKKHKLESLGGFWGKDFRTPAGKNVRIQLSGGSTDTSGVRFASLPLMSPLYNMREVCKQIVLLEDHLNQTEKRCPDCITKHFITIEALIEEGLALDKDGEYREKLDGEAEKIRSLQSEWAGGRPPADIAQELRAVRKKWLPGCFDIQKVGGRPNHYRGLRDPREIQ